MWRAPAHVAEDVGFSLDKVCAQLAFPHPLASLPLTLNLRAEDGEMDGGGRHLID